jgi:HEAT repeat protein
MVRFGPRFCRRWWVGTPVVAALLLLRHVSVPAEGFDLGPLDIGMRLLKLSTRDLRVKPEYVEDQIGGDDLRLEYVSDGLRGAVGAAARAQELGSQLAEGADLARTVEELSALLDEGRVPIEPPSPPLDPRAPLAVALQNPGRRGEVPTGALPQEVAPKLPLELRLAVAELIYGVARADQTLARTLRDLPPEDLKLLEEVLPGVLVQERSKGDAAQALRVAARLDARAIVSATAALTSSVCTARELLGQVARNEAFMASAGAAEPTLFSQDTEYGRIVIAGTGDNVHETPAAILIDLGGRDRYEMAPTEAAPGPRVRVLIDLSGDDTYAPAGAFGPSAALLGISMLVDEAGNDDYTAREPYAFGAALCGAGILVDASGNDRYMSVVFGEGAAMFGLGLLLDGAGDDVYEAELYAQGFGCVKGVGALLDAAGKDRYQAGRTFSFTSQSGERVLACAQGFGLGLGALGAPGGVGILADGEGADVYTADTYSQGAAWWYGGGLLYDQSGDDQYQGAQYTQGAGGFLSIGCLLDEAGNDRYSAAERGQGFGLERGIGILRDAAGDDSYTADRLAQGAAMNSGIGMAIDLADTDTYVVREEGEGFVPRGDALGTIALFGDGGGTDSYAGRNRNNLCWSDGQLGIGVDTDTGDLTRMRAILPIASGRLALAPRQPTGAVELMPIPGVEPPAANLDELWLQAVQADDLRRQREAKYTLARLEEQAVPFLVAKLGDEDENCVRVAQGILEEIGTAAVPELVRLMDEGTEREARAAMAALGTISDPRAAGHLVRQAKSPRWRTRAAAAGGMGAQYGEDTRLALEQLLRDSDEDVRRSAVVALRRRGETESAEAVAGLLGDPVYSVRAAAADTLVALVSLGVRCPPHVFSLVGSGQQEIRHLSIETCGRLGGRQSVTMLVGLLKSDDWADRAFAAEAICRIGDQEACDALRAALAEEINGLVQAKARTAMKVTRLCEPLDTE